MKKRRIVATLAYGKIFSPMIMTMFIVMLFCGVMLIPLLIVFAILRNEYLLLLGLLLSVLCIFLSVYAIVHHIRIKREINLWKQDAVLLMAKSKIIEEKTVYDRGIPQGKEAKVSVKFQYNENKLKHVSGEKIKKDIFHSYKGFDSIFLKYGDCEIDILYSPRFDQVMILK